MEQNTRKYKEINAYCCVAKNGNITKLKEYYEHGYSYDSWVCAYSAYSGNLEVLQ
jgi:hypothetical protein